MSELKLFDLVKAWNDDRRDFIIGCYHTGTHDGNHHVLTTHSKTELYKHAVKIPHELAEQLRKLDGCAEEVSENG